MHNETKKILKTKDEVVRLLKKFPEYRDNDERLVAKFWYSQLRTEEKDPTQMSAIELLKIYSENNLLTSADCIVRARAKAQQDQPELRGSLWDSRHGVGESVKKEINKKG